MNLFLSRLAKVDNSLETILDILEEVSRLFDFKKISFVPLSTTYKTMVQHLHVPDNIKYLHKITYHDECELDTKQFTAIARGTELLSEHIIFKSLHKP